jgi:nicotinic acid mononucleotide adenylyltransferase
MIMDDLTLELRAAIDEKKSLYTEKYSARVYELKTQPFPISSTEIREKIQNGEDCSSYVPRGVLDIIEEKGLYL